MTSTEALSESSLTVSSYPLLDETAEARDIFEVETYINENVQ